MSFLNPANWGKKSSELQSTLKEAKVGDSYKILKEYEDDIYAMAEDNDKQGLIDTLVEEGKLKKPKARNVANKLLKARNTANNHNNNVYNNREREIEHTTLNNQQYCHNHIHQQYEQKQEQVNIQQEVVIRGQVLLDATKDAIKTVDNYLKAYAENAKDKDQISHLNEAATTALKLYRGNCKILRKKQKQDSKMDFSTAFTAAEVPINEYEQNLMFAIQNHGKKDEIIARLTPMLNYMRCTLRGIKPPKLGETNNFVHNKDVVKDALSQALKGMNHTIPDRIQEIERNPAIFQDTQRRLAAKANKSGYKKHVNVPNAKSLQQDINGEIYPPATKQEMQARLKQDLADNAFRDPYDVDYGHYDNDDEEDGSDNSDPNDIGLDDGDVVIN